MPARPTAARTKTTVPRGASFKLASYASDQGKRSYKLYIPAKSKVGPPTLRPDAARRDAARLRANAG